MSNQRIRRMPVSDAGMLENEISFTSMFKENPVRCTWVTTYNRSIQMAVFLYGLAFMLLPFVFAWPR